MSRGAGWGYDRVAIGCQPLTGMRLDSGAF